jgi:osmoprotectant transport system substrate-binding protein
MLKNIALTFAALLMGVGFLGAQPLVIGSKIDTEGALLGKIIVKVLAANGIAVTDKTAFGTTDIVRKAILAGELDLYPEYTGNGGFLFSGTDPSVWKNAGKAWETVKKLDLEKNGLVWLTPAPANNTWAIAVRGDLAKKEKLVTLDDLGRYIAKGGVFKISGSEEFLSRPDALPAFQTAYGFSLRKDQFVSVSGGNTSLTEKAASLGTDGVNAAMAYGTDGAIAALGLVVLTDTKGVQPVYQPAPLVGAKAAKAYPQLDKILAPVFKTLDLVTLQGLNARIQVNGEPADAVASDYLKTKGFLK